MANSRPPSLLISPEVFDEKTANNLPKTKRPAPKPERSSSSSNDSTSLKNVTSIENNSSSSNFPATITAASSITTDSDIESEQEDSLQAQARQNDSNSQDQVSARMKHFHKLFKSEIRDDIPDLIDSYVCAYQGDILLQGKMYITDRYLCFHSRIISYVTKHVYRWEQIEDVTKERVAFIFPTAIGIQLKETDKKIVYASFLQRDQAYEKIRSVWSRLINDGSSYDDDEESDLAHDGTLKATNANEKINPFKRDSYEVIDGPEQDGVLQMYLQDNKKRPVSVISSKSSGSEKQSSSKILMNSYNKKLSEKTSSTNKKMSNSSNEMILSTNQTTRHSRYTKNERKQNEVEKRNSSVTNHRSKTTSVKSRQSHSQDRSSTPVQQPISHSNSSPTLIPTIPTSIDNPKPNGVVTKLFNMIIPLINLITQSILSLVHHVQTFSIKTTTFMLIFLMLLFVHVFYLIQIANRIETRLQSLHHHLWSSSLMKDSLPANSKDL